MQTLATIFEIQLNFRMDTETLREETDQKTILEAIIITTEDLAGITIITENDLKACTLFLYVIRIRTLFNLKCLHYTL